jgi:NAD(P)-dependent dehydrogenase (short-subunit alcohol dehydrogenase family)
VTQHAREQVVVADVNGDAASATAAALVAEGIDAVACAGDVGKRADADAFVSAAVRHFGGVDILIANAGIVRAAPFLDMTEEVRRTRRSAFTLSCPDARGFAGFRRGAARELERSVPGARGVSAPCAMRAVLRGHQC